MPNVATFFFDREPVASFCLPLSMAMVNEYVLSQDMPQWIYEKDAGHEQLLKSYKYLSDHKKLL